jgi:hypothetical protein
LVLTADSVPDANLLRYLRTTSNRLAESSITTVDSQFKAWQHADRSRDNALSICALRSAPLRVRRDSASLVVIRHSAGRMQLPLRPRSFNSASPYTRHIPTSSVPVNVCDTHLLRVQLARVELTCSQLSNTRNHRPRICPTSVTSCQQTSQGGCRRTRSVRGEVPSFRDLHRISTRNEFLLLDR